MRLINSFSKNKLATAIAISSSAFLAACGGGGSSSSGGGSTGGGSTGGGVSGVVLSGLVTGRVADGYILGATSYIDINGNKQLDVWEPSGTTPKTDVVYNKDKPSEGNAGLFNMDLAAWAVQLNSTSNMVGGKTYLELVIEALTKALGKTATVSDVTKENLQAYFSTVVSIPVGAIDMDSPTKPLTKSVSMSAPPLGTEGAKSGGDVFVSPVTTMVQQKLEAKKKAAGSASTKTVDELLKESKQDIQKDLGVKIDPTANYVQKKSEGGADAAEFKKVHTVARVATQMLASTLNKASQTVTGGAANAQLDEATKQAIIDAVTQKVLAQLDTIVTISNALNKKLEDSTDTSINSLDDIDYTTIEEMATTKGLSDNFNAIEVNQSEIELSKLEQAQDDEDDNSTVPTESAWKKALAEGTWSRLLAEGTTDKRPVAERYISNDRYTEPALSGYYLTPAGTWVAATALTQSLSEASGEFVVALKSGDSTVVERHYEASIIDVGSAHQIKSFLNGRELTNWQNAIPQGVTFSSGTGQKVAKVNERYEGNVYRASSDKAASGDFLSGYVIIDSTSKLQAKIDTATETVYFSLDGTTDLDASFYETETVNGKTVYLFSIPMWVALDNKISQRDRFILDGTTGDTKQYHTGILIGDGSATSHYQFNAAALTHIKSIAGAEGGFIFSPELKVYAADTATLDSQTPIIEVNPFLVPSAALKAKLSLAEMKANGEKGAPVEISASKTDGKFKFDLAGTAGLTTGKAYTANIVFYSDEAATTALTEENGFVVRGKTRPVPGFDFIAQSRLVFNGAKNNFEYKVELKKRKGIDFSTSSVALSSTAVQLANPAKTTSDQFNIETYTVPAPATGTTATIKVLGSTTPELITLQPAPAKPDWISAKLVSTSTSNKSDGFYFDENNLVIKLDKKLPKELVSANLVIRLVLEGYNGKEASFDLALTADDIEMRNFDGAITVAAARTAAALSNTETEILIPKEVLFDHPELEDSLLRIELKVLNIAAKEGDATVARNLSENSFTTPQLVVNEDTSTGGDSGDGGSGGALPTDPISLASVDVQRFGAVLEVEYKLQNEGQAVAEDQFTLTLVINGEPIVLDQYNANHFVHDAYNNRLFVDLEQLYADRNLGEFSFAPVDVTSVALNSRTEGEDPSVVTLQGINLAPLSNLTESTPLEFVLNKDTFGSEPALLIKPTDSGWQFDKVLGFAPDGNLFVFDPATGDEESVQYRFAPDGTLRLLEDGITKVIIALTDPKAEDGCFKTASIAFADANSKTQAELLALPADEELVCLNAEKAKGKLFEQNKEPISALLRKGIYQLGSEAGKNAAGADIRIPTVSGVRVGEMGNWLEEKFKLENGQLKSQPAFDEHKGLAFVGGSWQPLTERKAELIDNTDGSTTLNFKSGGLVLETYTATVGVDESLAGLPVIDFLDEVVNADLEDELGDEWTNQIKDFGAFFPEGSREFVFTITNTFTAPTVKDKRAVDVTGWADINGIIDHTEGVADGLMATFNANNTVSFDRMDSQGNPTRLTVSAVWAVDDKGILSITSLPADLDGDFNGRTPIFALVDDGSGKALWHGERESQDSQIMTQLNRNAIDAIFRATAAAEVADAPINMTCADVSSCIASVPSVIPDVTSTTVYLEERSGNIFSGGAENRSFWTVLEGVNNPVNLTTLLSGGEGDSAEGDLITELDASKAYHLNLIYSREPADQVRARLFDFLEYSPNSDINPFEGLARTEAEAVFKVGGGANNDAVVFKQDYNAVVRYRKDSSGEKALIWTEVHSDSKDKVQNIVISVDGVDKLTFGQDEFTEGTLDSGWYYKELALPWSDLEGKTIVAKINDKEVGRIDQPSSTAFDVSHIKSATYFKGLDAPIPFIEVQYDQPEGEEPKARDTVRLDLEFTVGGQSMALSVYPHNDTDYAHFDRYYQFAHINLQALFEEKPELKAATDVTVAQVILRSFDTSGVRVDSRVVPTDGMATNPDTGGDNTGGTPDTGGNFFENLTPIDLTLSGEATNAPVVALGTLPEGTQSVFAYVARTPVNLLASGDNDEAAALIVVDAATSSLDLTALLDGSVNLLGNIDPLTNFDDGQYAIHLFASTWTQSEVEVATNEYLATHSELNEDFVKNVGVVGGANSYFATGSAVLPDIAQWREDNQLWMGLTYDLDDEMMHFNINIHDQNFDKSQLNGLTLKADGEPIYTFSDTEVTDRWAEQTFAFVAGQNLTLEWGGLQVGQFTLGTLIPQGVRIVSSTSQVAGPEVSVTPELSNSLGLTNFEFGMDVEVMMNDGSTYSWWLSTHDGAAYWDGTALGADLTIALRNEGLDPANIQNLNVRNVSVETDVDGLQVRSDSNNEAGGPNTGGDNTGGTPDTGGNFFDNLAPIDLTLSGETANAPVVDLGILPEGTQSVFAYVARTPVNLLVSGDSDDAAALIVVDATTSHLDLTALLDGSVSLLGNIDPLTNFGDGQYAIHLFASTWTQSEVEVAANGYLTTHSELNEDFVKSVGVVGGANSSFATGSAVLPDIAQWREDDQIWTGLNYSLDDQMVRFNLNINEGSFDKSQLDGLTLKLDDVTVFTFDSTQLNEFDHGAEHKFDFVGNEGKTITLEHNGLEVGRLVLPLITPTAATIGSADFTVIPENSFISIVPTLMNTTGVLFDLVADVEVKLSTGESRYYWLATHEGESTWNGSVMGVDLKPALQWDGIDPTSVSEIILRKVVVETVQDGLLLSSEWMPNNSGTGNGNLEPSIFTVNSLGYIDPSLALQDLSAASGAEVTLLVLDKLNIFNPNSDQDVVGAVVSAQDGVVNPLDLRHAITSTSSGEFSYSQSVPLLLDMEFGAQYRAKVMYLKNWDASTLTGQMQSAVSIDGELNDTNLPFNPDTDVVLEGKVKLHVGPKLGESFNSFVSLRPNDDSVVLWAGFDTTQFPMDTDNFTLNEAGSNTVLFTYGEANNQTNDYANLSGQFVLSTWANIAGKTLEARYNGNLIGLIEVPATQSEINVASLNTATAAYDDTTGEVVIVPQIGGVLTGRDSYRIELNVNTSHPYTVFSNLNFVKVENGVIRIDLVGLIAKDGLSATDVGVVQVQKVVLRSYDSSGLRVDTAVVPGIPN